MIIGAGVAGISAAYTLEYLKVPYVILEASGHHGGRVHRNEGFVGDGIPLNVGAEWIHQDHDASVLQKLLLFEDDIAAAEAFIPENTIAYEPRT